MQTISPFLPADGPDLVALFREMQAHYRVPCPPDDAILADLQSLPAGVTLLLARAPGVVGVATLGTIYPGPGLRRGLFLKDLFVTASRRGEGIGAALMQAAARHGVATGASRLDWTADHDDAPLLAFYRGLGATGVPEKLFFRLSGNAMHTLAQAEKLTSAASAMCPEAEIGNNTAEG